MNHELLDLVRKAAVGLVILLSYVGGHVQATEQTADIHHAEGQGIAAASQAVRDAVRLELAPLRRDIQNLNGAVDTLWDGALTTNRRLESLEQPEAATATAASWRRIGAQP